MTCLLAAFESKRVHRCVLFQLPDVFHLRSLYVLSELCFPSLAVVLAVFFILMPL